MHKLKTKKRCMTMKKLSFMFLFCVVFASVIAAGAEKEKVKIDDDTIELQVSPQMRNKIQRAFERGTMYDENGVTVIELDDENSKGVLADGDDAIVIAPPEDRSSKTTLSDTLKSAVSPTGNSDEIVSKIAKGGANLMCKAFLAVLPFAVRMGYGLDLMSDGIARSILGKPQKTQKEKEALWNEYVQWEMKIQKSGKSLQYMVFEYDEYVDDSKKVQPKKKVPAETKKIVRKQKPAAEEVVEEDVEEEDIPQKVVTINNFVQTTYVAPSRRNVVLAVPGRVRPRGHRIRHRVHYLPGIRRSAKRHGPPPRPVVIRKKRHHHAHVAGRPKRFESHRRPKVVMHTKGYRRPARHARPAPPRRGNRR